MKNKTEFTKFYQSHFEGAYREGEVKYFNSDIKKALAIIMQEEEFLQAPDSWSVHQRIKNKMNGAGLNFLTLSSSGTAYVGRNQVVKVSFLRFPVEQIPFHLRIPTKVIKTFKRGYSLMIQPKAETTFDSHRYRSMEYQKFRDGVDASGIGNVDIKPSNVGFHKGKLVMFDW